MKGHFTAALHRCTAHFVGCGFVPPIESLARVIRAALRCIAPVIIQHDERDETLRLRKASIITRCHYKSLFPRFTHGGYTSLQPSENIT